VKLPHLSIPLCALPASDDRDLTSHYTREYARIAVEAEPKSMILSYRTTAYSDCIDVSRWIERRARMANSMACIFRFDCRNTTQKRVAVPLVSIRLY